MKRVIYILVMLGFFCFGYSELRTITLSNAIDLAMLNNLQLQQSEKDLKIAEDQYNGSIADFWMPSINLSGNTTLIDQGTVTNSEMILPLVTPQKAYNGQMLSYMVVTNQSVYADNYSASLSISKPLFAGFRNWNSMEIKRINLEMAKAKYEDSKRQVISSVSTAFYNLFLLEENIRLTSHLDKSLKERLDYTRQNFKAGAASQFDMIRAEVAYKHNQPILSKINNGYASAKMDFCNSIGIKDYTNTGFLGNLTDSTNIQIQISEDQAISQALSNDINIKTIEYKIKTLKLSKDIAASAGYPVVSAFFNDKYNYGLESFGATNRSWYNSWNAGIQVSVPLDTLLPVSKAAYNVDEAEQNIKKTLLAEQQLDESISLQVRSLFMQISQAKESIESQSDTLNQSKFGLEIANNRYKEGTSSLLDVSDAEVSYTQSQVAYLQAVYDYFSSVIQLKKIIGE